MGILGTDKIKKGHTHKKPTEMDSNNKSARIIIWLQYS